jgi:hypothetical protein
MFKVAKFLSSCGILKCIHSKVKITLRMFSYCFFYYTLLAFFFNVLYGFLFYVRSGIMRFVCSSTRVNIYSTTPFLSK